MTQKDQPEMEIFRAVARLQAGVLAFVMAVMGGLTIFIMTAWLVIKGGEPVGPHLQLLANYFIGYSVTWPGSFVGMGYGAFIGGIAGWSVGAIYNRIVIFKQRKNE